MPLGVELEDVVAAVAVQVVVALAQVLEVVVDVLVDDAEHEDVVVGPAAMAVYVLVLVLEVVEVPVHNFVVVAAVVVVGSCATWQVAEHQPATTVSLY